jgi:hypothetical protein
MLWLFKQSNTIKAEENSFIIIPADVLLQEDGYAKQIKQLKELLSVTKDIYQDYYLQPLLQLAARVQHLPAFAKGSYHVRGGFLKLVLQRTIVALKYRRSMMLPIGAPPELQYHEHDLWTYAVYTASLLMDCWMLHSGYEIYIGSTSHRLERWYPLAEVMPLGQNYQFKLANKLDESFRPAFNALMAPQLVSAKGLQWLAQAPHVFDDWLSCITYAPGKSTIGKIITQAQATVLQEHAMTASIQNETSCITEVQAAQPVATNTSQEQQTVSALFLSWLKQFLQQNLVNHSDAMVFRTEEGLLAVMPITVEAFIKNYRAELASLVVSTTDEKLVESVLAELIKAEYVIPHANDEQNFYHYYLGEWKERRVLQGLLIKPEALLAEDNWPAVHPDCHLEI